MESSRKDKWLNLTCPSTTVCSFLWVAQNVQKHCQQKNTLESGYWFCCLIGRILQNLSETCRSYFTPKLKEKNGHASNAMLPYYITIMHFGNVNNYEQQTPNYILKPVMCKKWLIFCNMSTRTQTGSCYLDTLTFLTLIAYV